MSWQTVFTSLGAFVGAIVLFSVTQTLAGIIIQPTMEFRRVISKIALALIHATDFIATGRRVPRKDGQPFIEIQGRDALTSGNELGRLAGELWATCILIPSFWYWLLTFCRIVPPLADVKAGYASLLDVAVLFSKIGGIDEQGKLGMSLTLITTTQKHLRIPDVGLKPYEPVDRQSEKK